MELVPQAFFTNFALLIEAPNGVAKLRELILQLAIEGRLVTDSSDGESARALLARISFDKQRRARNGKGNKTVQEIESTEIPFHLPSRWEWVRLGDICELENGDRSKNYPSRTEFSADGIPFINAGHLQSGAVSTDRMNYIPETRFNLLKSGKVREGDILFCLRGSLGKSAIVENIDRGAIASSLVIIRLLGNLNKRFVLTYLFSPLAAQMIKRFDNGTAQPNLSSTDLGKFLFPLAPLEQQTRIVAKVDELMRLCDELEERQQRKRQSQKRLNNATLGPLNNAASLTPEVFKQASVRLADNFVTLYDSVETVGKLRSTILQLGVQGKLAEQYLDDEAILIKGESFDARDILFQFPPNWVWARFDQLAEIVSGVTKGRKLDGRKTAVYPYLRVANVQRWFLDLRVMKEIEILEDEIEKYRLKKNDLLITEGGDWDKVGRTAIWNDEIENCVHQNHVFRARLLRSDISPIWVMTFVNSATGRTYFERASKQTTNLASINMRQLRACPIAVPPLAEQKRIVAKVNQLMSLCDELETKLRQAETDREKLMNTAVQHVLQAVTDANSFNGLLNAPTHKHLANG